MLSASLLLLPRQSATRFSLFIYPSQSAVRVLLDQKSLPAIKTASACGSLASYRLFVQGLTAIFPSGSPSPVCYVGSD